MSNVKAVFVGAGSGIASAVATGFFMMLWFGAFNGRNIDHSIAIALTFVLVAAVIAVAAIVLIWAVTMGSRATKAEYHNSLVVAAVTLGVGLPFLAVLLTSVSSCTLGVGLPWPPGDVCSAAR